MKDNTKQHLFYVHESKNGFNYKEYPFYGTDAEMTAFLKARREMEGYIPGVGGNRNYVIWAIYAY